MQEINIDAAELDRLVERLAQSPEIIREAKRRAFESASPKLLALVQAQIGGTGRVKSWQGKYVGSRGGYAAVRPRARTWIETKQAKRYAVGYVTNAVNSGHRKRGRGTYQDKRLKSYKTISQADWVGGRHFYEAAQEQAAPVAQEAAEEIVAALLECLEG